jgi:phosphoribosylamine--glycine ligase
MRILVVGDGGRERALAGSLTRFRFEGLKVGHVLTTPHTSIEEILRLVQTGSYNFVIVGPEEMLAAGLVDTLTAAGIPVFGPTERAAELESSKTFMKTRCVRWGIRTAPFDFAGSYKVAKKIIDQSGFLVVKADGLCKGKGVYIADTPEQAHLVARNILEHGMHKEAGKRILLEQKLKGRECSVMAICDGKNIVLLPPALDYKRSHDNDEGSNTGGMGAVSPVPYVDDAMLERIRREIFEPALAGMAREGRPFHGALYAGVMLVEEGGETLPYLLEFNVRPGDPETQAVLPLIKSDLIDYLQAATVYGGLSKLPPLEISKEHAVAVVLADQKYPAAGTKRRETIFATGTTLAEAREKTYAMVRRIDPEHMYHYRTDIGANL